MIFKEMVETVIGDIDEDITDMILVKKIKGYINRGYKELAKRERLEKKITTEIVAGLINVPSNAVKVYEVLSNGIPLGFTTQGKKVICNGNGEVDVILSYIPDLMENDDDEPVTNMANEEFILAYAKWLYFLSDDQIELSKLYKQEYESFKIITKEKTQQITDVYGVI